MIRLLLCAAALVALAACDRQAGSTATSQPAPQPSVKPPSPPTPQNQEVVAVSSGDYQTQIRERAIRELKALEPQFSTDPYFSNSIAQTLKAIEKHDRAMKEYGMIILPGTFEHAELPCPPGKEYETFFRSEDYWTKLGSSFTNYGYVQSGQLQTSEPVQLMAKDFLVDSFPPDVLLIERGEWRGFFTKANGDLIIPGKRFYEDILSRQRLVASMPKTPEYYVSQTLAAEALLDKKDYGGAIGLLTAFLEKKPMAPPEAIARAYHNLGYLKEQQGDVTGAISAYTSSIRTKPLVSTYVRRASIYDDQGRKAQAEADMTAAIGLEQDPKKKQDLEQLLMLFRITQ